MYGGTPIGPPPDTRPAISTTPLIGAAPASAPEAGTAASFAGVLGDQQRRLAATDVLGSMPPMVTEQIKRGGPAPVSAVHELFKAIKSGEFMPSSEQLAARDCIIATTARAAETFESPEAMWETMREMLGAAPLIHDAVQYARTADQQTVPDTAISTREEANAILGGPIPASKLNWWETALRFLLDESHAATLAARNAALEVSAKG